jgi:hypothetical protein
MRDVASSDACQTCATSIDRERFSLRCRSCGTLLSAEAGPDDVPPDLVVPFQIQRDQVRAALNTWKSSRRFAPGALRDAEALADAEPVFLPYWMFGAETVTSYKGRRGDHHWVTRDRTTTDSEGRQHHESHQERETKWHRVHGEVWREFQGVLVPGSTLLPEKLPAWPLSAAEPYGSASSSDSRTIRYDRDSDRALVVAQREMEKAIVEDCRADIGGDAQVVSSTSVDYRAGSTELVLLPAWFLTYTFRSRQWTVLVNGFSGEVSGERPYSAPKIMSLVGAVALVVAVLGFYFTHR